MIITRTPFRLTLGGGGTDLPSFYREHGGFVLAVGIDKYMYLAVTLLSLTRNSLPLQNSELVDNVDQVEHTLAREALRYFDLATGIEIVSIADIPAGTGLGSSSCYMVGLLNGLHALMQRQATPCISPRRPAISSSISSGSPSANRINTWRRWWFDYT